MRPLKALRAALTGPARLRRSAVESKAPAAGICGSTPQKSGRKAALGRPQFGAPPLPSAAPLPHIRREPAENPPEAAQNPPGSRPFAVLRSARAAAEPGTPDSSPG